MGDYASLYLALEYGINPTPVKVIDYLKAELAR
jgi:glucose/mannose-6-phosphate isomerase